MADIQSPLQELEEGPHSGPYLRSSKNEGDTPIGIYKILQLQIQILKVYNLYIKNVNVVAAIQKSLPDPGEARGSFPNTPRGKRFNTNYRRLRESRWARGKRFTNGIKWAGMWVPFRLLTHFGFAKVFLLSPCLF